MRSPRQNRRRSRWVRERRLSPSLVAWLSAVFETSFLEWRTNVEKEWLAVVARIGSEARP